MDWEHPGSVDWKSGPRRLIFLGRGAGNGFCLQRPQKAFWGPLGG
jgi:hypothetical protein